MAGDWVRIQPQNGFEGTLVRVLEVKRCKGSIDLICKDIADSPKAGDALYLTRQHRSDLTG